MRVRAVILAASLVLVPLSTRAEILLGVAAPFSGPFEYGGEQWLHGVRLAVAVVEVNAAGGLSARRSCSILPMIFAMPSRRCS